MRNPPPICAEIPDLHKFGSLCVDFYNVTFTQNPGACVRIEAKLLKVTIEKVDIGCFHIPHNRFHPVVAILSRIFRMISIVRKKIMEKKSLFDETLK